MGEQTKGGSGRTEVTARPVAKEVQNTASDCRCLVLDVNPDPEKRLECNLCTFGVNVNCNSFWTRSFLPGWNPKLHAQAQFQGIYR
jgi:hypothetical protein